MANLNKVFLIGRLTQDPELRYTPGGSPVTDLRLAVNRVFGSREGETKEETLYVDVTVWNRQAETACQYLKKGRQVHVEGFLRMETWEDKATGQQRSKIKVQADNVQFLDSRGREEAGPAEGDEPAARSAPRRGSPPEGAPASRTYGPGPQGNRRAVDSSSDEPSDPVPHRAGASEADDDIIPF